MCEDYGGGQETETLRLQELAEVSENGVEKSGSELCR